MLGADIDLHDGCTMVSVYSCKHSSTLALPRPPACIARPRLPYLQSSQKQVAILGQSRTVLTGPENGASTRGLAPFCGPLRAPDAATDLRAQVEAHVGCAEEHQGSTKAVRAIERIQERHRRQCCQRAQGTQHSTEAFIEESDSKSANVSFLT